MEASSQLNRVLDVVCGMRINPSAARETKAYKGKSYSFCSHTCAVTFEREPERHLAPQ